MVAIVLAYGPAQLYDQVVRYRVGSAQAEGWSLLENLDVLGDELAAESTAWLALAFVALPLCLAARNRRALLAAAWTLPSLALLLVYSPLAAKHAVILLPPLAVLIGVGLGTIAGRWDPPRVGSGPRSRWAAWRTGPHVRGRLVATVGLFAVVGWYLPAYRECWRVTARSALPGPLAAERATATRWDCSPGSPRRVTSSWSTNRTWPTSVGVGCRRRWSIRPSSAYAPVRSPEPKSLPPRQTSTCGQCCSGATACATSRSSGTGSTRPFGPVKIYERRNGKDRALYLRNDADFAAARPLLRRADSDGPDHLWWSIGADRGRPGRDGSAGR